MTEKVVPPTSDKGRHKGMAGAQSKGEERGKGGTEAGGEHKRCGKTANANGNTGVPPPHAKLAFQTERSLILHDTLETVPVCMLLPHT
jgi:hypothetical protein